MARKADPTSVRQRAFKMLDGMKGDTRTNMMNALRSQFAGTERYYETLWSSHRRRCKENGTLIEVFSIKEMKDGKPCAPYLKTEFKFNPSSNASRSVEVAMARFKNDLAARLQIVEELL